MAEGYISHDDDDDDDVDDSHDDQRQPLFAGPSTDDGLVFDTLDREHIESDDLHGDHPREVGLHCCSFLVESVNIDCFFPCQRSSVDGRPCGKHVRAFVPLYSHLYCL